MVPGRSAFPPAGPANAPLSAARLALEVDDLEGALGLSKSGVALADGPSLRGPLRRIAAEAHLWRNEAKAARAAALEARAMLPPGHTDPSGATAAPADQITIQISILHVALFRKQCSFLGSLIGKRIG